MALLTLYSGLLLPWLAGAVWLVYVEARLTRNPAPNYFRQAGYGFFLGYAFLFFLVGLSENLYGSTNWLSIILLLLMFTVVGGLLVWRTENAGITRVKAAYGPHTTSVKILTVILLVWTAVHFIFLALEVFTQPLYPWDAWLAWVYRAKAWFMAGGIVDVVRAQDWAATSNPDTYTIGAWIYPLFPSVIPYWAALSLGYWSETLINLPALFAGTAIGMALYGQCREHGLTPPQSLVCCYFLYSIPLFGTHIALAGYADIWMAGFAGLGFMALIRGAAMHRDKSRANYQSAVGFLMIGLAMLVKNEAVVWFLVALVMAALVTFRLRVCVAALLLMVFAVWLAAVLGFTQIDIPKIGILGMVDGRLLVPFVGKFSLEVHQIHSVYWENFFAMGNWNLLWVLIAISLFMAFKLRNTACGQQGRRASLSFILLFLSSQIFIFGFTDQGLWADTYTAINRLPLHFVPALLFAVVVMLHPGLTATETVKAVREAENGDD